MSNTVPKKMFQTMLNHTIYDGYRFYVPISLIKNIKFIKKWFKISDRGKIPLLYKRRKCGVEFAEVALMILARIEDFYQRDYSFIVGSTYLDTIPWASFGVYKGNHHPRHIFQTMESLFDYYSHYKENTGAKSTNFLFRSIPEMAEKIGGRYKKTAHFITAISLALLYDLLINAGPDCYDIFDIYTNDLRDTRDSINIDKWEELRCKALGSKGAIRSRRAKFRLGRFDANKVIRIPEIIQIAGDDDDLAKGEDVVTRPVFCTTGNSDANIGGEFYDNYLGGLRLDPGMHKIDEVVAGAEPELQERMRRVNMGFPIYRRIMTDA